MCNTVYSATKRGGSQRPIERNSTPRDQSSPLFSAFFPKLSFLRMPRTCNTNIYPKRFRENLRTLSRIIRWGASEWRFRRSIFLFFQRFQSLITSMKFRCLYGVILFSAHSYTRPIETHCAQVTPTRIYTRVKLTIGIINFSRLNT